MMKSSRTDASGNAPCSASRASTAVDTASVAAISADAVLTTRRRLLIGAGAVALASGCARRTDPTLHLAGGTMGTSYNLKLARTKLPDSEIAAVQQAVQQALDAVEERMSLYRAGSELSQFNRVPAGRLVTLSPALHEVLTAARSVSALSDGAFDVTVAPLVQAWGFGTDKRSAPPQVVPTAATAHWTDLLLLPQQQARKAKPLQADLSGIAKGYGVDRAAQALDALGCTDYMIEAGGEVRVRGRNGEDAPWRIGIEQPDASPPRVHRVVPLLGGAMATSGDYRIFYEHAGRRYSHEIDPVSGAPITHRLCSVTVLHADCMQADALATALIVLGPERGFALAQAQGIAAYFIERTAPGVYRSHGTSAFGAAPTAAAG
jgi:thiamine biosynthesis lipoprotein